MGSLMRSRDWSAGALGPPHDWPPPLCTALHLLLSTNHPIFVMWGPDLLFFYNDAYRRSIGPERHPSALGEPGRKVWEEIWDLIGEEIDFVLAGKGPTWNEDRLIPITRNGRREDVYWTYSYGPISHETAPNGVGGVLVIVTETTRNIMVERRLSFQLALESRLRPIEKTSEIQAAAAESLGRHLGAGHAGYGEIDPSVTYVTTEKDWTDGIMPSFAGTYRLADFGELIVEEFRKGRTVRIEDARTDPRLHNGDAARLYERNGARAGIALPLFTGDRLAAAVFVHQATPRSWTEEDEDIIRETGERTRESLARARAEKIRRNREEQLRFAVEAGRLGSWVLDLHTNTLEASPICRENFGWQAEGAFGYSDLVEQIVDEDRQRMKAAIAEAIASRNPCDIEYRVNWPDRTTHWLHVRGQPFYAHDGTPERMAGISLDITNQKKTEQYQQLLINELNHRVKNTLATVQSIASQTFRLATSVEGAAADFGARLMALSRAQSVLTRESWSGAGLTDIVASSLKTLGGDHAVAISGPKVILAPRDALAISFALHELSTNAVKHGALSVRAGRVDIDWKVVGKPPDRHLRLTWTERGGPLVGTPARQGYGTRWLTEGLAREVDGNVTVDFAPDGLVCIIDVPLSAFDGGEVRN